MVGFLMVIVKVLAIKILSLQNVMQLFFVKNLLIRGVGVVFDW